MEKLKLDRYFEYLTSGEVLLNIPVKIGFPKFEEFMKLYKSKMKQAAQVSQFLKLTSNSEIYTIPYDLPGGGVFKFDWNIDKINNVIKKRDSIINNYNKGYMGYKERYKIELILGGERVRTDFIKMTFNLNALIQKINEEDINKDYAMTRSENNKPIICLDFTNFCPSEPPIMIVDGNHRCFGKYKAGIKTIDGYVLGQNLWIHGLLTELDTIFVKVIINIDAMKQYMVGLITERELQQRLYYI